VTSTCFPTGDNRGGRGDGLIRVRYVCVDDGPVVVRLRDGNATSGTWFLAVVGDTITYAMGRVGLPNLWRFVVAIIEFAYRRDPILDATRWRIDGWCGDGWGVVECDARLNVKHSFLGVEDAATSAKHNICTGGCEIPSIWIDRRMSHGRVHARATMPRYFRIVEPESGDHQGEIDQESRSG